MKNPVQEGRSDNLRALTEHPELRALMDRYFAVKPSEREPYAAFLEAFIAEAAVLSPDWREIWEAAGSDGRVVRALAIHCVLRIRARSDLDELERFEANTAEADFVTFFAKIAGFPNASLAFQMMLAFYELMRIAKLDPEEMEELRRRAVRDSALNAGNTAKQETARSSHAKELTCEIVKENPGSLNAEIVEEIPNRWRLTGVPCFTVDWLKKLVGQWRRDGVIPPPTHPRRRRTYLERRYRRS
jgi:hypothetical protein